MNPATRRFGTITAVQSRSVVDTVWLVIDATVGVTIEFARGGARVGKAITRPLRPLWLLTALATRPPLVAARYWPAHLLPGLAETGRAQRHAVTRQILRDLAPFVVAEILDQIDLTELVRARVDLVGLARYVMAAIDLPEIIRESAGSPTPGAEQGIRVQSIETDQAIAAWVDRVFFRPRTD